MTPIDSEDEDAAGAETELVAVSENEAGNPDLSEVSERRARLRAFESLMQLGDAEAGYRAWRERKGFSQHGGQDSGK